MIGPGSISRPTSSEDLSEYPDQVWTSGTGTVSTPPSATIKDQFLHLDISDKELLSKIYLLLPMQPSQLPSGPQFHHLELYHLQWFDKTSSTKGQLRPHHLLHLALNHFRNHLVLGPGIKTPTEIHPQTTPLILPYSRSGGTELDGVMHPGDSFGWTMQWTQMDTP